MILQFVQYGIGMAFALAAVVQDIKQRKIKNVTVLICLAAGIIFSLMPQGPCTLKNSLIGAAIPLVLFPLFALKMLGAGDIKAFCALGAVFGLDGIIKIIILSFICGGGIALGLMFFLGGAVKRFGYFFRYLKNCIITGHLSRYEGITHTDAAFRFSYAIAAGTAGYILCRLVGLV